MFTVMILTICAGWCLVSIAAALLIGAAVERRDADLGCGDGIDVRMPMRETPVRAISVDNALSLARN